MYRLLRADAATRERRAVRRHPVYTPPAVPTAAWINPPLTPTTPVDDPARLERNS